MGYSRQHLYESEEGVKVTHPDYRFFEARFCYADLRHLLFDKDHLGEMFHGMELAEDLHPADWDSSWEDLTEYIDESDNILTVGVFLKRLKN